MFGVIARLPSHRSCPSLDAMKAFLQRAVVIPVVLAFSFSVIAQNDAKPAAESKPEKKAEPEAAKTDAKPADTNAAPAAGTQNIEDLPSLFELTRREAVKGDAKS